jgi:hypothetical protein
MRTNDVEARVYSGSGRKAKTEIPVSFAHRTDSTEKFYSCVDMT